MHDAHEFFEKRGLPVLRDNLLSLLGISKIVEELHADPHTNQGTIYLPGPSNVYIKRPNGEVTKIKQINNVYIEHYGELVMNYFAFDRMSVHNDVFRGPPQTLLRFDLPHTPIVTHIDAMGQKTLKVRDPYQEKEIRITRKKGQENYFLPRFN